MKSPVRVLLIGAAGRMGTTIIDVAKADSEIVETHHKMKKDAPSGTAKTLAEVLKAAQKIRNEIPIQSIREGDVIGEHTVIFSGPAERLELTHRAANREIFARGALRAGKWIMGRPAGLYSMQDVLGL